MNKLEFLDYIKKDYPDHAIYLKETYSNNVYMDEEGLHFNGSADHWLAVYKSGEDADLRISASSFKKLIENYNLIKNQDV